MITPTQQCALARVVQQLSAHHVAFQITGGLAALIYGSSRPLYDIDIDVAQKDMPLVCELFRNAIVMPLERLQDENFDILMLTIELDGVSIDISQAEDAYCITPDGKRFRMETNPATARRCSFAGLELPVQRKADLIAYKRLVARETDLFDIAAITEASG